jgi:hypothetical protein
VRPEESLRPCGKLHAGAAIRGKEFLLDGEPDTRRRTRNSWWTLDGFSFPRSVKPLRVLNRTRPCRRRRKHTSICSAVIWASFRDWGGRQCFTARSLAMWVFSERNGGLE